MASSSKSLNVYAPASPSAYPYTFGVSFNENSTSIENNTSSVTVTGTMYAKDIRWSGTTNTLAVYWFDNNKNSSGKLIGSLDISTFTKKYTYSISDTITVEHNSDGSLKGYAKLVFTKNHTNNYAPNTTNLATDEIDLTYIPRSSSIEFGTGYVEEALSIKINRSSTSFTHKITYNFGDLSGTVASNVGDSYSWIIPSSFYNQIGASSTYKTGTLSLETYNGSTKIGDTISYPLTVYCRESKCTPTLSGSIVDSNTNIVNNITGSSKTLVDYMSDAKITLNYTPKNGASIAHIYINNVEQSVKTEHTFKPNAASYVVTVVDSRGYQKSVTFSPNASGDYYFKRIEYIPLSFTAVTKRPTQTGSSMQVSIDGKFYNGSFGSVSNSLSISWKYRVKGATYWTTGSTSITLTTSGNTFYATNKTIGSSWNYQKTYEFEYTISDKLMSLPYTCVVPKGTSSFVVFENGIMLNGVFLAVETAEEW